MTIMFGLACLQWKLLVQSGLRELGNSSELPRLHLLEFSREYFPSGLSSFWPQRPALVAFCDFELFLLNINHCGLCKKHHVGLKQVLIFLNRSLIWKKITIFTVWLEFHTEVAQYWEVLHPSHQNPTLTCLCFFSLPSTKEFIGHDYVTQEPLQILITAGFRSCPLSCGILCQPLSCLDVLPSSMKAGIQDTLQTTLPH